MQKITKLIRADSEFSAFVGCMRSAFGSDDCLPIAVNGLTGGAESAFAAEAVREAIGISHRPVLILVESEAERVRLCDMLSAAGIRAVGYPRRDLVFYNIRASHDLDRERLSVLSSVLSGECEVVVSTPSAAAMMTISPENLTRFTIQVKPGDLLSPEDL